MPKSKKEQAPARKPVRARGSLPSPVTAPKREELPWYKKRNVQGLIAFAVLFVGIVGFNLVQDARESRGSRRLQVRPIEQFERKLNLLNAPLAGVYQAISTSPEQLTGGSLSADDYRTQAQGWVDEFRKLYEGVKSTEVDPEVELLTAAKASFTQGSVILLDAAKTLLDAAASEGEARQGNITLGRNLLSHGGAVISMGERQIQEVKNDYELNDPPAEPVPAVIPEEEAPPPTPADTPVIPPEVVDPNAAMPDPNASPAAAPSP